MCGQGCLLVVNTEEKKDEVCKEDESDLDLFPPQDFDPMDDCSMVSIGPR